jgi:purine catabolism regulator
LVAAAEANDLPLLEVPERTAFIAVSKAVSALLGVEEHAAITRAFEAQRDLTRAALAPNGAEAAVASRLARHVGGWVLVLDRDGRPVAAAPAATAGRSADLVRSFEQPLASLRTRGLLASSSVGDAEGSVVLHPLGARGRVRGFLAVGTPTPLDRNGQSVVAVAVSLLSIAVEQPAPGVAADGQLRAAALSLLLSGARPADLPLAALDLGWLTTAPVRVLAVRGTDPLPWELGEGGPVDRVSVADDGDRVVVVADRAEVAGELAGELAGRGAGGSGPVDATDPTALARGRREATQALATASGERLVWHAGLAGTGMLAALDPDVAPAVAEAMLAPLDQRKGDLVASLAAWLARHGQWDTAAADLGVHRHTLRYRIRRVEDLLGRSLDDPDLRAELWLALRVREPAARPPATTRPSAPRRRQDRAAT